MNASPPLVEHEHCKANELEGLLQTELADVKRKLKDQSALQCELEWLVGDLERRLELEALERLSVEAQKEQNDRCWAQERGALQQSVKTWQARYETATRRRAIAEESLRRAEQQLFRMHQKKFDMEQTVRREDSELRQREARIVRNLVAKKVIAEQDRSSCACASSTSQRSKSISRDATPPRHPKATNPTELRTRQALCSAMGFFGISWH